MSNTEKLTKDFIEHFKSLSEPEQFKLGFLFNKETGGKLSPYNSPNPVSVALIQIMVDNEINLLGVRRGIPPKIGEVAFPGGFVDKLEDPLDTAVREVIEETGFQTYAQDYELMVAKPTPGNQVLLFYLNKNIYNKDIMKDMVVNSEVSEFILINKDTPLAFPTHKNVLDDYFKQYQKTNNLKKSY